MNVSVSDSGAMLLSFSVVLSGILDVSLMKKQLKCSRVRHFPFLNFSFLTCHMRETKSSKYKGSKGRGKCGILEEMKGQY